jgi:hypothetical protein
MAIHHEQLGDTARACELYDKTYAIFLATYGPDHENTIKARAKAAR